MDPFRRGIGMMKGGTRRNGISSLAQAGDSFKEAGSIAED
jgi:hypothetical protein